MTQALTLYLPLKTFEDAIKKGEVTVDELMHLFGQGLTSHMKAAEKKFLTLAAPVRIIFS